MSDPNVLLSRAVAQRDATRAQLVASLERATAEGRADMTNTEHRLSDEVERLEADIADLQGEVARRTGIQDHITRRFGDPSTRTPMKVNDADLVYRQHDRNTSWLRDLAAVAGNVDDTGEARQRLARHSDEVRRHPAFLEARNLSRVDGQGGYAVPPAWLMDQYVELARPGRAFANLVQRQPLPGGTDSINIPKLLSGTAVGIQTADNTVITEVDATDTFVSAPVRTIAGQEGVALQLLDQSPLAYDEVIFRDLIAAYATAVNQQVLFGTGSSGQVLGVDYTAGIQTIAVSALTATGVYSAIANAIQLVHTTRFLPPEVIVMHPRRWGWLLSLADTTGRPLFVPNAQGPMNAQGVLTDVASQQIVGTIQGLPVVTDPSISVTNGSGSPTGTEDVVYVVRASDLVLFEGGVKARACVDTRATTLTVLLQAWGYVAFTAARFPQSVVQITGFTAPTW